MACRFRRCPTGIGAPDLPDQAIDIEGIKRSIMRGNSRPTAVPLAPELPFYDASLDVRFPYDVAAAKAAAS